MPPSTWIPKDAEENVNKCNEESLKIPGGKFDILTDTPEMRAHLLCRTKAMNIYTEDEGFHMDRLAYMFFNEPEKHTDSKETAIMQDCVNKNKNISAHDERVYKTFRCIAEIDKKNRNNA